MAEFTKAFMITVAIEGGYVNDPDDNGGETYKGISRANFPDWKGWYLIDTIKKSSSKFSSLLDANIAVQTAVAYFYQDEFWNALHLGEVNDQSIANELFDTAVNMGKPIAANFLQRTLNVLNDQQKIYADIAVDGSIGAKTIMTLNQYKNPRLILKLLNALQGARYITIAEANPRMEKYMVGWFTRVML